MIAVDSLTGTYGGFADDARRRRVEGPTVSGPVDHPHPAPPTLLNQGRLP